MMASVDEEFLTEEEINAWHNNNHSGPMDDFNLLFVEDGGQQAEAIMLDNCCMNRNVIAPQQEAIVEEDACFVGPETTSNVIISSPVKETEELFNMMDSLIGISNVEQSTAQPLFNFTAMMNGSNDYPMINRKHSWRVNVEQVDAKKEVSTYNFRTFLRITVEQNGRYVAFKPTHLGFYKDKKVLIMNNAELPTEKALSWDRFGSSCYKQSKIGNYFVVLQVEASTGENVNIGLDLTVSRVSKPGTSNTLYNPITKYTWFEIDDVKSYVDATKSQLPSLWSEKSLERECNSVYTCASCPDSKVTQTQVASLREKSNGSSSKGSEEKPRKKTKKHK